MTTPIEYFKRASDQALIDRHKKNYWNGEVSLICAYCQEKRQYNSFPSVELLKEHIDKEHKAMNKPKCRDCNCVLNAEEIEAMPDKSLAFGQCSACKIIETQVHPCGNCTTASVGPGRTLCAACLEKMKG